jgi:hypothetical protein
MFNDQLTLTRLMLTASGAFHFGHIADVFIHGL